MVNLGIWTYLYYASGIVLAIAAIIGLWQLFILKHDINTRNKRAAMENSIKLIDRYREKLIKISEAIYKFEKEKNVPNYEGTPFELPAIDIDLVTKRMEFLAEAGIPGLINESEAFSAAVLSGLSDEEFVFRLIGRPYCNFVAQYYDIFATLQSYSTAKSCVLELFDMWRKRLIKIRLELEKKELSAKQKGVSSQIQDIIDKKIPFIK